MGFLSTLFAYVYEMVECFMLAFSNSESNHSEHE